jgi:hypothetical protein
MAYVALPEKHLAEKFEKYLKSGSGRAFAIRHLLGKADKSLKANSEPTFAMHGPPTQRCSTALI